MHGSRYQAGKDTKSPVKDLYNNPEAGEYVRCKARGRNRWDGIGMLFRALSSTDNEVDDVLSGNQGKDERKKQQGYAIILVASVLMVITVLGLTAVMFSTAELEGAATQRQWATTKQCAELGLTRITSRLYDADIMTSENITVFGKDTMELPYGGTVSEYTYWVGHYGEQETPMQQITHLTGTDLAKAIKGSMEGMNLTNAYFGFGGAGNSGTATFKVFSVVVTCRSPSGLEVEVQGIVKRGLF